MKRLYPGSIRDEKLLSRMLRGYLVLLEQSPLRVDIQAVAWESRIPEAALNWLAAYHLRNEEGHPALYKEFRIVFANLLFRYPTIKIWEHRGEVFFEI